MATAADPAGLRRSVLGWWWGFVGRTCIGACCVTDAGWEGGGGAVAASCFWHVQHLPFVSLFIFGVSSCCSFSKRIAPSVFSHVSLIRPVRLFACSPVRLFAVSPGERSKRKERERKKREKAKKQYLGDEVGKKREKRSRGLSRLGDQKKCLHARSLCKRVGRRHPPASAIYQA